MLSHESSIKSLEDALGNENDMLKLLKQLVDKNLRDKELIGKKIIKNKREAKSYQGSLKSFNDEEFRRHLSELNNMKQEVLTRRDSLDEMRKRLSEFEDLKPTNEALREKVEEMKKSRLSLEMSMSLLDY